MEPPLPPRQAWEALFVDTNGPRDIADAPDASDLPGIYVFTFPRYWQHSDPKTNLLKIGSSKTGVVGRIREQIRHAAVPEDPLLVRIYLPGNHVPDPRALFTFESDRRARTELEAEILLQNQLDELGLRRRAHFGGTEWFSTDLATIDQEATALRMPLVLEEHSGLPITKTFWRDHESTMLRARGLRDAFLTSEDSQDRHLRRQTKRFKRA